MVYPHHEPYLSEESQYLHGEFVPPEPGLAVCEIAAVYIPRNPEESVLYGVVAAQLETFLERQARRDRIVPRFVERELRSFLECGIFANGFLRVHCDACRLDRVVPFSCKRRGFCPSCGGRRMADTAAHLVDWVFPEVPIRQWVLSLPIALRYRLAYDARLVRDVLPIFVQAVFGSLRRRAGFATSNRKVRCGAVTFVQRFGDALNLNVHFHMLALDGIYYLGYGVPVGPHIKYFITLAGEPIACLCFAGAAWRVEARDRWIGWNFRQRERNLRYIVNNTRFVIFPWINVPNLASRLLALAAKRIAADWQRLYAYQPLLLETFVDSERYAGTCYLAANWLLAGYTKGRGKLDRQFKANLSKKAVLLYPLTKDATRYLRG
jgi:hypothetical protein